MGMEWDSAAAGAERVPIVRKDHSNSHPCTQHMDKASPCLFLEVKNNIINKKCDRRKKVNSQAVTGRLVSLPVFMGAVFCSSSTACILCKKSSENKVGFLVRTDRFWEIPALQRLGN